MALSALRRAPLILPDFRVDSFRYEFINYIAWEFSDYEWAKRPVKSSEQQYVPACWTIQQAFDSMAQRYGYATIDDYFDPAANAGNVYADVRWGKQGTVVRAPRAIIVGDLGFISATPASVALADLEEELVQKGIFAGAAVTAADSSLSIPLFSLLHNDYDESFEGFALTVDEEQSIGGEVLFVIMNDFYTGFPNDIDDTPYHFGPTNTTYTAFRTYDLDLLERIQPRFAKVKYLYLHGGTDSMWAGAVAECESFAADAPADMIDYRSFPKSIKNLGVENFQDAVDAIQEVAREFFELET